MNATEQKQRHVAVRTAEKRLDDMELVIVQLASELVAARDAAATRGQAIEDTATERWLESTRTHARLGDDLAAFAGMGLWARLCWLVRGVR